MSDELGPVGLCIACAHYKVLALYKLTKYGQTPDEPEGLCRECRDAALPVRGSCDHRCRCSSIRLHGITEEMNHLEVSR